MKYFKEDVSFKDFQKNPQWETSMINFFKLRGPPISAYYVGIQFSKRGRAILAGCGAKYYYPISSGPVFKICNLISGDFIPIATNGNISTNIYVFFHETDLMYYYERKYTTSF